MLEQGHFLLTYSCNLECDHCFVYSSPQAEGTFTLRQIRGVCKELARLGTVQMVYFEGGEPFLFYPLLLEGIKTARAEGFRTGIVTNGYWATSVEDAKLWLGPLAEVGVADISISDDLFHYAQGKSPAKCALEAAKELGIRPSTISIDEPKVEAGPSGEGERGRPVVGGGAKLRGRAVDKLLGGLPRRQWQEFVECPYEDLRDPKRVHLDPYGNVHICQGLSMGNMWETPLSELVQAYDADRHPICGPLLKGGPAKLVERYGLEHQDGYVDECHLCYSARLSLLERFPEHLAPKQVYGVQ